MRQDNYCIKPGYTARAQPEYFDDTPADDATVVWQPDVYALAAHLGQELGCTHIIDLGCGHAQKLAAQHPRFNLIGIDYGGNIQFCRRHYPFGEWIEADLETDAPLSVSLNVLRQSILVCADVIEHLVNPAFLLKRISTWLDHAPAAILSTPERDLTRGLEDCGPPLNPSHVREWNLKEFETLLRAQGFHVDFIDLTVSNNRDLEPKTSLAVLGNNHRPPSEAPRIHGIGRAFLAHRASERLAPGASIDAAALAHDAPIGHDGRKSGVAELDTDQSGSQKNYYPPVDPRQRVECVDPGMHVIHRTVPAPEDPNAAARKRMGRMLNLGRPLSEEELEPTAKFLKTLLEAPNIVAYAKSHRSDLTPTFLALLSLNVETAQRDGQEGLANMLLNLERVLKQIARSEGEVNAAATPRDEEPPRRFPCLPIAWSGASIRTHRRVCIVSSEFIGPVRNGGIGTFSTNLGEALASAGHEVTLLFTRGVHCDCESVSHWVAHYKRKGICFLPLPGPTIPLDAPPHLATSYAVYLWLKDHQFDVVHFPEWGGVGYFTLLAKHQGLSFTGTLLCVGIHGPSAWTKEANGEFLSQLEDLELDFMERQSVALADVAWSPSQYLLGWMQRHGWELPKCTHAQQLVMPHAARTARDKMGGRLCSVRELVFFGRLEWRKGLALFCDALDRLGQVDSQGLRITFLGRSALIAGRPASDYIRERARQWPWEWQVLDDLDQGEAIQYARGDGRLAVIPSLIENSPNTVYECLGGNIPFIAAEVGGIPELIAPSSRKSVLFASQPQALADRLRQVLEQGVPTACPAIDPDVNERAWVEWHGGPLLGQGNPCPVEGTVLPNPLVSLCITHFNRPEYLRQSIEAVGSQDYPCYEVILVDDGSTRSEALTLLDELEPLFAEKGWRIIRQDNRYLGAARNAGAAQARGEYLIFLDDDDCPKPNKLSTYVRVAQRTGADILTSCNDYFSSDEPPDGSTQPNGRYLPLGNAPAVGVFKNCFGGANALIRVEAFRALGGFSEDYGVGYEDWEFFARASLQGFHLETVPEGLLWYRTKPNSMVRSTAPYANHKRKLRPYLRAVPEALRTMIEFAYGLSIRNDQLSRALSHRQLMFPIKSKLVAGNALLDAGQMQQAKQALADALEYAKRTREIPVILEAMVDTTRLMLRLSRPEEIISFAESGIRLAEQAGRHDAALTFRNLLDTTRHQLAEPVGRPNRKRAEKVTRPKHVRKEGKSSPKRKEEHDSHTPGIPSLHPSQAAQTLQLLLDAEDLAAALEAHKHRLDAELLALVRLNAETARADGAAELAEGLDGLAEYVAHAIA